MTREAESIATVTLDNRASDHICSDSIATVRLRTPLDSSIAVLHKGLGNKSKVLVPYVFGHNLFDNGFIHCKVTLQLRAFNLGHFSFVDLRSKVILPTVVAEQM
jgi:hypothetical protein